LFLLFFSFLKSLKKSNYYYFFFFDCLSTGGGDNIVEMTYRKFDTGFTGCVRRIYFKSRKINLQADASLGWNVLPCDIKIAET